MKVYITLEDTAQSDDYNRLQILLSEVGYSVLGSYSSRNYITFVVETKGLETEILEKIEYLKQSSPILEVSTAMKLYGVLNRGVRPADINPRLRENLKEANYEASVYPSHSINGINYIGINIKGLNPLNVEEMNKCKQTVQQIKQINKLIVY